MDRAGGKAAGGGGERIAYVDAARGLAIRTKKLMRSDKHFNCELV